jgi:hypothetical protein
MWAIKVTITAIESFLENKEYAAARKELNHLIEIGAHQQKKIGQRILWLYEQLKREEYCDSLHSGILQ